MKMNMNMMTTHGVDPLNIVLLFSIVIVLVVSYIYLYKKREFNYFVEEVKDFILFISNLTLVFVFDRMFNYKHYYERKRNINNENVIANTEIIHSGRFSKSERANGRSKRPVKKNGRTIKK